MAKRRTAPDGHARDPRFRGLGLPLTVALLFAAGACSRLPRPAAPGVEIGLASWYGPEFHGRQTASREVFDMNDLTAAHRTLPFGTQVLVTNLENDRTVVVRINDRGPFVRGRIIDLSYGAARILGLVGPGTARVRMEVLGLSPERPAEPPTAGPERVWLQVGAFTVQENAHALRRRLIRSFPEVVVSTFEVRGRTYYRVRVPTDDASLEAVAARLAAEGLPVIVIRERARASAPAPRP